MLLTAVVTGVIGEVVRMKILYIKVECILRDAVLLKMVLLSILGLSLLTVSTLKKVSFVGSKGLLFILLKVLLVSRLTRIFFPNTESGYLRYWSFMVVKSYLPYSNLGITIL